MKIFIAEDEPLAAQKLQLFLEKLGEQPSEMFHFSDGVSLMSAMAEGVDPDVLFLDIQMPGLTGIEVLRQLQTEGKKFKVIITSAYDQYAIDGFNFGVTDYLLKPYTLDRLRQAIEKVRPDATISLRVDGRTEIIHYSDIVCLEALKDYTQFTLADGRQLQTLGTLSGFEQQLPKASFVRVQRSYIVSLNHVKSYNTQSVTLSTGVQVPVGKTYRDSFSTSLQR